MMTWLLIDTTYLCRRAWHASGVVFGAIDTIENQVELHAPDNVVFAFDSGGRGLRAKIDPTYKANRYKDLTEQEAQALKDYREQESLLRTKHLPAMGYRNIFASRGYEADDIIAGIASDLHIRHDAVIITADNDLWQCLRMNVCWHNPVTGKTVTFDSFTKEWDLHPIMWADVKAFAGCSTDGIQGIRGVGDKTAAKWFAGTLKPSSKKYQLINDNLEVYNRNIQLTRLPLNGYKTPELKDDEVTELKKNKVKAQFGMGRTRVSKRKRQRKPAGFDLS